MPFKKCTLWVTSFSFRPWSKYPCPYFHVGDQDNILQYPLRGQGQVKCLERHRSSLFLTSSKREDTVSFLFPDRWKTQSTITSLSPHIWNKHESGLQAAMDTSEHFAKSWRSKGLHSPVPTNLSKGKSSWQLHLKLTTSVKWFAVLLYTNEQNHILNCRFLSSNIISIPVPLLII